MSDFKTIIGLEIHTQLKTKSKMFCGCSNSPVFKPWVKDFLENKNVSFEFVEHEYVTRPINSAKARNVNVNQIAKALVYICDDEPVIFVLPGDRKLDESKAKENLSFNVLRMANPDEVFDSTGCVVGLVPPLIAGVRKIIDKKLLENELLSFNAGIATAGIKIKKDILLDLLDKSEVGDIASEEVIVDKTSEEKPRAQEEVPNTRVCPVCLGMPGTLPVANKEAIRLVAKIGLALGSELADLSWFDRKHYFYPDLPKGYQISQYQKPFCAGGELEINGKLIKFNRVHLEEDAGKLVHPAGEEFSFVDLNRAGTPLAELVTEPDLESPLQAKEFLQELRDLLRSIGVSDADMEKGHLRCDANISVWKDGKSSPIVEIKNLNSFKFVEKALSIEQKRLQDDCENWPEHGAKITRGFNSTSGDTYVLREKEEAKDYRYFPEPDLPPIKLSELFDISEIENEIGKLPILARKELADLGLDDSMARLIVKDEKLLELIDSLKEKIQVTPKFIKTLVNEKIARELSFDQLVDLSAVIEKGISSNVVRNMITEAKSSGNIPSEIEVSGSGDAGSIVDEVLSNNSDAIEKYKSGKTQIIGFLIGEVMKKTQGSLDPNSIKQLLINKIEEK